MYKFNDREITFNKYNTPTPWMNYLSNGTFHTMISQAGGGVAFYKSPQIWRINHYRFFHLPTDRSGFYTYIKDNDDIWCPTNEPCKSKPDKWSSTHGMGYTRFEAEKNGLEITQEEIHLNGHAIECRINAENPDEDFRPCPGKIQALHMPGGPGVRIDSAIYQGYTISPYYDSMIAKLIVHAPTRKEAIQKMRWALSEFIVEGIDTNIDFQLRLIKNKDFEAGTYDNAFLTRWLEAEKKK